MISRSIPQALASGAIALLFVGSFSCPTAAQDRVLTPKVGDTFTGVYWSDGDSGKIGPFKFRLRDLDAPETAYRENGKGAQCEAEIQHGYRAKEFVVNGTRGKDVRIDYVGEMDRYGRYIVDLSVNGVSIAEAGFAQGFYGPWPHRNGRALAPSPDWCKALAEYRR